MQVSGLEDEYQLSGGKPQLIYVKIPAPEREPRLQALLDHIRAEDAASYQKFATPEELREQIANDLALLLTERFTSLPQIAVPRAWCVPDGGRLAGGATAGVPRAPRCVQIFGDKGRR